MFIIITFAFAFIKQSSILKLHEPPPAYHSLPDVPFHSSLRQNIIKMSDPVIELFAGRCYNQYRTALMESQTEGMTMKTIRRLCSVLPAILLLYGFAAAPQSSAHAEQTSVLGDLNEDGIINAVDLTLLKRGILSDALPHLQRCRADTNADGKTDRTDADAMRDYLLSKGDFAANTEKRAFYYAIDMTWQEGVTESLNAGFTDTGYVNLDNQNGSSITWKITVPENGSYMCSFGTANGSNVNRKMKIEVNQNADYWMQDFPSTGAWTNWEESRIVLPLTAGINTIRMISATAEGGPNFDYLKTQWTDEPYAQTYAEAEPDSPPVSPDGKRTVWLAGDSTVQTYGKNRAPQQGWGAHLSSYLPQGNTVINRAISGRSAKSFSDKGDLKKILNEIQPGDYLLVQFGINDGAFSMKDRYCPTCGKVPGTSGSFEWYTAQYIEGAKEKGALPILITTPIHLDSRKDGKFVPVYVNYCDAAKRLAAYYKIPCVDLNTLMVDHYNQIGYNAAFKYHMCSTGKNDVTHFTETGAKAIAALIADEMKKQHLV